MRPVDEIVVVALKLQRQLAHLEIPRSAERTGVTSAAVPVRNICSKLSSSSGQIARSLT